MVVSHYHTPLSLQAHEAIQQILSSTVSSFADEVMSQRATHLVNTHEVLILSGVIVLDGTNRGESSHYMLIMVVIALLIRLLPFLNK